MLFGQKQITDKVLLRLLLDEHIRLVQSDALIGKAGVMGRSHVDADGQAFLELNLEIAGKLHRKCLPICLCVHEWWDGSERHRQFIAITHDDAAGGYVSLGSLLDKYRGLKGV